MAVCPLAPMQKTFPLGIRTQGPISMEDACTSSTGVEPALTHWFSEGIYFSAFGWLAQLTVRTVPSGSSVQLSSFERAAMFPAAAQVLVAGVYRAVRASPRLPASNRPSASSEATASPITPQPGFPMLVHVFVTGL